MDYKACSQSVVRSPPTLVLLLRAFIPSPWSAVLCLRLMLLAALLTLQFMSKNTFATEVTKILGIYMYIVGYCIERGKFSANLKPTGIVLRWPNYGTRTLARCQRDKVSHFCSIHSLYFLTPKHVRKFRYKPLSFTPLCNTHRDMTIQRSDKRLLNAHRA